MIPPFTPASEADFRLNLRSALLQSWRSIVCGVLFGCAPAWQTAQLNLSDTLKESDALSSSSAGRHGFAPYLVVVEFALALTLLTGAGLVIHSSGKLSPRGSRFRQDHILTFFLPSPTTALPLPN